MRAISDRRLPEPYRSWIDGSAPLPSAVRLLPRTVDVGGDVLAFLALGLMFGVMGALFVLLPPWRFDPATEGWQPYLFLAAICLALWSVPVLLFRRVALALWAQAELKRGTLRQGVLIGPEGVLVRMEPNRCHAIPADRFVLAKLFPPEKSRDPRKRTLIVETLDGVVEFFAERLAAHPEQINTAAAELWPGWSRPKRLMRADRRKLKDFQTRRRMLRAAYLFAGSMLVVMAATVGVIKVGGESADASGISLVLFLGLLFVAGATVNLFVWFFRFKLSYRCPECRGKAVRVHDALPAVHFYCPACNVEWDTGIEEQPGTS